MPAQQIPNTTAQVLRQNLNTAITTLNTEIAAKADAAATTAALAAKADSAATTAALAGKADSAATAAALASKAANAHTHNASDLNAGTLAPDRLAPGAGLQVFRRNAANNAVECATISVGGGDMLAANNLSDVANVATARNNLGLGSVNNTSDTAKPVSTATQAALDLKAPLASPTLTGTPAAPTASPGTNTTQIATTAFVTAAVAAGGGGGGAVSQTTETLTSITANAQQRTVSRPAGSDFHIAFVSAANDTGSYAAEIIVADVNSPAEGDQVRIVVGMPATYNGSISVKTGDSAGPIAATFGNTGSAAVLAHLDFVYKSGAFLPCSTIDQNSGVGGGEVNTVTNIGTEGIGVFKQKTGVNFEFKKLKAGAGVTISETEDDEIQIDSTGGGGGGSSTVVSARRTTTVSAIPNGSSTVTFNIEDVDTDSAFNPATGVFTAPITGLYLAQYSMYWKDVPGGLNFFEVGIATGAEISAGGGVGPEIYHQELTGHIAVGRGEGFIGAAWAVTRLSKSNFRLVSLTAGDTIRLVASTNEGQPSQLGFDLIITKI